MAFFTIFLKETSQGPRLIDLPLKNLHEYLFEICKVYQARLRASGNIVAVKVQRPGVRAAISLDILILRYLAGLVKKARKFNTDLQVIIYAVKTS